MASALALSFLGKWRIGQIGQIGQIGHIGPMCVKSGLCTFNTRLLYFDRLAKEQVGRLLLVNPGEESPNTTGQRAR